jgi:hypothetical protein
MKIRMSTDEKRHQNSSDSHLPARGDKLRCHGGYSCRTCGRPWRGRQQRKKRKMQQNELAISLRTRPVTRLAGPPTARVPPWYVATIQQQRKAGPHPSEEGRGSQPRFQVEKSGRRGVGGGGKQERNGNRSGVTLCDAGAQHSKFIVRRLDVQIITLILDK